LIEGTGMPPGHHEARINRANVTKEADVRGAAPRPGLMALRPARAGRGYIGPGWQARPVGAWGRSVWVETEREPGKVPSDAASAGLPAGEGGV
jgi:hypothetical protein